MASLCPPWPLKTEGKGAAVTRWPATKSAGQRLSQQNCRQLLKCFAPLQEAVHASAQLLLLGLNCDAFSPSLNLLAPGPFFSTTPMPCLVKGRARVGGCMLRQRASTSCLDIAASPQCYDSAGASFNCKSHHHHKASQPLLASSPGTAGRLSGLKPVGGQRCTGPQLNDARGTDLCTASWRSCVSSLRPGNKTNTSSMAATAFGNVVSAGAPG